VDRDLDQPQKARKTKKVLASKILIFGRTIAGFGMQTTLKQDVAIVVSDTVAIHVAWRGFA
jgi:hypothetical protein